MSTPLNLLPPSVIDMLGIPQPGAEPMPTPDAISGGEQGIPAVTPTLDPATLGMLGIAPAQPVQNAPDEYITPPAPMQATFGKQNAATNRAHVQKGQRAAQQAYAQSQAMPTLADTVHEQQAATQQQADAIGMETQVAQAQAEDAYGIQQQAEDDLKANQESLQRQQQESDRIRADKQAAVDGIVREVDNYKVDHDRYWGDAGTGKKVGWLVAMAMSGIGDALQHKSGPNPVIGMLEKTIDADVRAQLMRRDELAAKLGRAKDGLDAFDRFSTNQEARILAKRAQAKELVAQQLLTSASKYAGDAALANGSKAVAELRKSSAKDMQAAVDMAHGHQVQDANLAINRQQVAISGGQLSLANKKFAWDKEKDEAALAIEVAKLNKAGDEAKAKLVAEKGIPGVYNKDGTPMVATGSSPEDLAKLKDSTASARQVVDIIDRVRRIRTGWNSETANSEEYQNLKSEWNGLRLAGKDLFKLGVIAGPDMDLLDGFFGSDDPNRFKNFGAGLKTARQRVLKNTSFLLQSRGLDGEFDVPDIEEKRGAAVQPGDPEMKLVLDPKGPEVERSIDEAAGVEMGARGKGSPGQQRQDWLYRNGNIAPAIKQTLDTFAAGMQSTDPKARELAFSRIKDAAERSKSEPVKAYAQQLLTNSITAGLNEAMK